jgi:hypothetical protein
MKARGGRSWADPCPGMQEVAFFHFSISSDSEIPDTAINRAMIAHGAKRTKDGRIVLEKRLVPQTSKRRIKPVKKLDL